MNFLKKVYRAHAQCYPWLWKAKTASTLYLRRKMGHVHEGDFRALAALRFRRSPPVFVDIGANHGQSITSMRTVVPGCAVVAFEPNPVVAQRLQRAYRRVPSVDIHAVGLSERPGELMLHMPVMSGLPLDQLSSVAPPVRDRLVDEIRGYGFVRASADNVEVVEIVVPVRTLDSFGLRPDFIKIDVEGHEQEVLAGARETLEQCRPHLLVERGEACSDLLCAMGYRRYVYEAAKLVPGELAIRDHLNSFFIHETRADV